MVAEALLYELGIGCNDFLWFGWWMFVRCEIDPLSTWIMHFFTLFFSCLSFPLEFLQFRGVEVESNANLRRVSLCVTCIPLLRMIYD